MSGTQGFGTQVIWDTWYWGHQDTGCQGDEDRVHRDPGNQGPGIGGCLPAPSHRSQPIPPSTTPFPPQFHPCPHPCPTTASLGASPPPPPRLAGTQAVGQFCGVPQPCGPEGPSHACGGGAAGVPSSSLFPAHTEASATSWGAVGTRGWGSQWGYRVLSRGQWGRVRAGCGRGGMEQLPPPPHLISRASKAQSRRGFCQNRG